MNTLSYLEQLAKEHGFTLDELQANRQGLVYPTQLEKWCRRGLGSAIISFVLGTIALFGGLLGAYSYYHSLIYKTEFEIQSAYFIGGAGIIIGLAFFVGAGMTLVKHKARKAVFEKGQIDVLEGPLYKVYIRGRGGASSEYIFRVAGRSYHTSRKSFELLTHGALYRLYCVDDNLLSFELAAPGT